MSSKSKKKSKSNRSGGNPSVLELKIKGVIERLDNENKLLNGEVSSVLEELYNRVNKLEARIEVLETNKNA